jgi:hypothetical protein
MNTLPLVTVTVKAADGTKRAYDLPRDGIASASAVRGLNGAAKGGLISMDNADHYRTVADKHAHGALEAGRAAMSDMRQSIADASPLECDAMIKAMLKLRVRRTF